MKVRYIVTLAMVAFVLHTVWENAQAPLYAGYQSFSQHFGMCLYGTVVDVLITLFVLAFLWLLIRRLPSMKSDYAALAIIGIVIAVVIEQNALLLGKWDYTSMMPLVPYTQVGFSPILQMMILLPLSFFLAHKFTHWMGRRKSGSTP